MLSQSINLESEKHSPLISNLVVSFLGLRNVFELSLFPNLIFHADGFKQSMVKKSSKDMGFQFILTYFDKLSHKNNFSKKFRLAYIWPNSENTGEKYDKYVVDCLVYSLYDYDNRKRILFLPSQYLPYSVQCITNRGEYQPVLFLS